jgi:hypothetical protein
MNSKSDNDDAGAPMPDFRASNIQLQTIAPALGVPSSSASIRHTTHHRPDYLEYDINPHGRGLVVTMFANTGLSYMIGIGAGGLYGVRHGFRVTPSQRFRVQLNSILNHTGRYGSRVGNAFGTVALLYSIYEWGFDRVRYCHILILSFSSCPQKQTKQTSQSHLSYVSFHCFFISSWTLKSDWDYGTITILHPSHPLSAPLLVRRRRVPPTTVHRGIFVSHHWPVRLVSSRSLSHIRPIHCWVYRMVVEDSCSFE